MEERSRGGDPVPRAWVGRAFDDGRRRETMMRTKPMTMDFWAVEGNEPGMRNRSRKTTRKRRRRC